MANVNLVEPTRAQHTQISKALGRMNLSYRFYAEVLMRLPLHFTDSVTTAATDGVAVYINPAFMEKYKLTVEQALFVLAHEVEHVVLEHPMRRGGADPQEYNISGDERINNNLFAAGMVGPTDERGRFMGYASPKYVDQKWSTELIYRDRQQSKPDQPDQPGDDQPQPGDDQPQPGDGQPGQPQPQPGDGDESTTGTPQPDQPDIMENGAENIFAGDVLQPTDENGKPLTGADLAEAHDVVRGVILSAAASAKAVDPGSIPAHLRGPLAELTDPKVDWADELRPYMTAPAQDDESWDVLDRRMINRRLALPGLYSERCKGVGFVIDTSGSVRKYTGQFLSEVFAAADDTQPDYIRVIFIDTHIQEDIVTTADSFESDMERFVANPVYGGGTNLCPAFEALAEDSNIEAVICLTDMLTPFPGDDYVHADATLFVDVYGVRDEPFGHKVLMGR